jgi:predicted O-methyltransferase YrrM
VANSNNKLAILRSDATNPFVLASGRNRVGRDDRKGHPLNSLHREQIAQTLDRLHQEAEASDRDLMARVMAEVEASGDTLESQIGKLVDEERKDYRAAYRANADRFLAVSPDYGRFLYGIARAREARCIVEFGTSMGVSTIYLAAALRDNGGGQLISAELESTKAARARVHLREANLDDLVEIREGDALETLKEVGNNVDLLLIDGAWSLYLPILKLIEPHLAEGAVVLGENAFDKDYTDYVRDPGNGFVSMPLPVNEGRGNEFAVRATARLRTPASAVGA